MKNATERILITGCGGMLGEALFKICSDSFDTVLATDIDLNEVWLKYLDVRDIVQCQKVFDEFKPTIVFHLAALTDLEFCERNPRDAWATNAFGTENIALLVERHNATIIYIGSAGIFDGTKDVYTDFDQPNPINYYGASKYHGERFVESNVSKYFIFRAGWMIGGGLKKDKKFIGKIFHQITDGATELFGVDDKSGTPTYTYDFVHGMLAVIPTKYYGLYNQVCTGDTNRFEVAREFVRLLGLADTVKVTGVSSDYFKEEYFAPRPRSETMINLKLDLRGMNHMRDWQSCLAEYSEIFKNELRSNPRFKNERSKYG